MALTTERKADLAYKFLKQVAQTSILRASYEETHPFLLRILPTQVWQESDKIPSTAPSLAPDAIQGVVQYKEDLVMTADPNSNIKAFYHADLVNAINPEVFGSSYNYVIKDNLDNIIPPGSGNYEVNPDAGVVSFDDSYTIVNSPIKITFYKYVGDFGVGGGGLSFVEDITELKALDNYSDEMVYAVFTDANGRTSFYKFDAADTTAGDDDAIVTPDDITEPDPGRWIKRVTIPEASEDLILGNAPATRSWDDGISKYQGSEALNRVLLDHDEYFTKIAPDKPTDLGSAVVSMTVYTALEASTGTSHTNCTDDTTPDGYITNIFDYETGDLFCEIDTVEDGRITLTNGDDTGTDQSLQILTNVDPHQGEGKPNEGWWMQLSVAIISDTVLTVGSHSYQLKHSGGTETPVYSFYVDDPATTTISAVTISLPVSNTRFVSGVPSLAVNDPIDCDFTVNDAVKSHYNATRLARITADETTDINVAPPGTPPATDDPVSYLDETVNIETNRYSEDVEVTITGYNSKDVGGTASNNLTGARVDTVSSEAGRLVAGAGQYPVSGYGGSFDNTVSLVDGGSYEEELQMLNGKYQRPSGNYSSNLPDAGPDYSGVNTDNAWDYVIPIGPVALSNNSSFEIAINGTEGSWGSDPITPDLRVYIKVEGVTGWLDANAAYPLTGSPVNDGDPAMVYAESTSILKKVTFGATPRTGNMYIRIGLPNGSDKKLSGITVQNIV